MRVNRKCSGSHLKMKSGEPCCGQGRENADELVVGFVEVDVGVGFALSSVTRFPW